MDIWTCKIGTTSKIDLPPGSDWPMRQAIARAFYDLTGQWEEFNFSGWGGELTESELAVVEDRLPDLDVMIEDAQDRLDELKSWKENVSVSEG